MFNCDEVIQLLTDYVDGELEPGAQSQLDLHFKGCRSCEGFLKTFKTTVELTGSFRCEDIPEEVSEQLHRFLTEHLRDGDPPGPDGKDG
jgi:anti-sigma factor RsiW